jgi:predicted dehydrogenase/threonine dehydrogenase-like Zn-dependent dehydrogenase
MKQVVQEMRSGKTQVREVPAPRPRAGMVLVRTVVSLVSAGTERAALEFSEKSMLGKARARPDLVKQTLNKLRREGISATLNAVRGRLDQPLPLGYSSAGVVVALGAGVQEFQVGDRVACAGGGHAVHAEYAVVPLHLLARLPDTVDFEVGAFATLGAIALHAFRLAEAQVGEQVAVIGLGLLGQLTSEIALAAGCRVLGIDLLPERVELARRQGVHAVSREQAEQAAAAWTSGLGCDAVLICAESASDDPLNLAAQIARDRGQVVAVGDVGLDLPRRIFYHKELRFVVSRSYGPGRYDPAYEEAGHDYPLGYVRWTEGRNLQAFVELAADGKLPVSQLVSHRFPVQSANEAYDLLSGRRDEPYLGILLTYPQAEAPAPDDEKLALREAPRSGSSTVGLGVLGAGNFASSVAFPLLRRTPGVELIGLTAASGLSAQHAGKRFGFRYAASGEAELLQDEQINTLAIFTRHDLHAGHVAQGLAAGKHVFCEKPLAIDETGLQQVIEALQVAPGLLTVGFNRRFAPLARRLKQFFGPHPEPLVLSCRVNAGRLPDDHWLLEPQQGGRLVGEACHFIDLLTFLAGSPPVEIRAEGLDRDRQGGALLQLCFADGSQGTVAYLSNGAPGIPKERVEVFGGGRAAVLDDFRRLELAGGGRRRVIRSRWKQDKGHQELWAAFVDAIRSGGQPPIPYTDLIAVARATLAAVESLRSGEAVTLAGDQQPSAD